MKKVLTLITVLLLIGCKTNQTINGQRHGKWISQTITENDTLKYIEKYKKGIEVKTWKTYKNRKLIKKEKYKNQICTVTNYYSNQKIESQGTTKSQFEGKYLHWFYSGIWKYYDINGNLIETKTF